MEKQNKVISKIKKATETTGHTPLGTKPNDECYTSMQDIINELSYWANLGKFRGKKIICPCDWDIVEGSNIYQIEIEFKQETKELVTCYKIISSIRLSKFNETGVVEVSTVKEEDVEEFLREKLTCNFVRTLVQNARRWGIKSVTASGYNPSIGIGVPFQDVDYSKYDICVTNPPFSLYAEFMNAIVGKIDFICLAPFLNRVTPNIGLPLMLKQAYLGFGRNLSLNFYNPTSNNNYKTKTVACDWIVSWPDAQKEVDDQHYTSGIDYESYKDEYAIYPEITLKDGTHPIRVPGGAFPDDYNGWMIASVSVLNKLDQSKYEWYGTNFMKYYNTTNPGASPFAHKTSNQMMKINGKQMFHGILFRKKK